MKRILSSCLALVVMAAAAFAQTPEEIVAKMDKVTESHQNDGVYMIMEMKLPIIGSFPTKTWTLGRKVKTETNRDEITLFTFTDLDANTMWMYDPSANEVEIRTIDGSAASSQTADVSMFSDVTEGYDLSIKKEYADYWQLECKKSKSNPDKDAPKYVYIEVYKNYFPKSLQATMSGVTIVLRDLDFNVTEDQVTFKVEDYPGVTITDKR